MLTNNSKSAGLVAGFLLLSSALMTACDSGSDIKDLQSRVDVAANGYNALSLTATNAVMEVAQSQQLTLVALTDGDSTGTSVESSAVWSVSNTDVATIDRFGTITGIADGAVSVRARYGPLFTVTEIRVSAAELQSIAISSTSDSVNECDSVQLIAQGNYSDGTQRDIIDAVVWSDVSTTSVGAFNSVDSSGFFRTSNSGTLAVTAARNGVIVDTPFTLNVLDSLNAISISEPTGALTASNDLQLTAIASYNDSTTLDITDNASWSVENTSVATIDNTLPSKGLLDASQSGRVAVSATCGGLVSDPREVLSGDPTVAESMFIDSPKPYILSFDGTTTVEFEAFIRLENQQRIQVTEDSTWTVVTRGFSGNTLSNSSGSKGELTIRGTGDIVIRAEYTGDDYDDRSLNIAEQTIEVD